jgi:hypothetical protein
MKQHPPPSKKDREDFAAYVRGDHPDQVAYYRYVLGQLRAARIRAQLLVVEITTIGVALKDGWIGPDEALEELAKAAALDFLQPLEPPYEREPDDARTHETPTPDRPGGCAAPPAGDAPPDAGDRPNPPLPG